MKTVLPESIKTVAEAKKLIADLFNNRWIKPRERGGFIYVCKSFAT